MVGMIFILFDIEAVFLYPWAVVYRKLKMFGFFEMLIFVAAGPGGLLLRVEEGRARLVRRRIRRRAKEAMVEVTHPAILETTEALGETTLIADPAADRGSVPLSSRTKRNSSG